MALLVGKFAPQAKDGRAQSIVFSFEITGGAELPGYGVARLAWEGAVSMDRRR